MGPCDGVERPPAAASTTDWCPRRRFMLRASALSSAPPLPNLPGNKAWILGTSFLVLAVPLIIEMDREQQVGGAFPAEPWGGDALLAHASSCWWLHTVSPSSPGPLQPYLFHIHSLSSLRARS